MLTLVLCRQCELHPGTTGRAVPGGCTACQTVFSNTPSICCFKCQTKALLQTLSVKRMPTVLCWAQSCPALCIHTDCSPPDSSVHGILPARILEWIAVPSSQPPLPFGERTRDCSPGQAGKEGPHLALEEGMAIHSSILAGRILWTEEPGGLFCFWLSQRSMQILHFLCSRNAVLTTGLTGKSDQKSVV